MKYTLLTACKKMNVLGTNIYYYNLLLPGMILRILYRNNVWSRYFI